jgi:sec-independent protein translocase protein TatB
MFDISWSEFLLIGVVALVVIGPKELPTVMRTLGQWTRKVRAMAADFQNQFQEAMREAEMADLKNEVDDLAHKVRSADPIKSVRDDFETMGSDFARSLDSSPGETAPVLTTPSAEPQLDPVETAKTETAETETAKTETVKTETAETETAAMSVAAEPVSAAADVAPAAADEPSSATPQTSPPRPERDENGRVREAAAAAEAAEPVADAEPANATGHRG